MVSIHHCQKYSNSSVKMTMFSIKSIAGQFSSELSELVTK